MGGSLPLHRPHSRPHEKEPLPAPVSDIPRGQGASSCTCLGCVRGGLDGCVETSWLEEAEASGSGLSQTISQLSGLEAAGLPAGRRMLPAPPARVRRAPCTSGLALDLPETSGFCFILFVVRKPDTQQALRTSGPAEAAVAAPSGDTASW